MAPDRKSRSDGLLVVDVDPASRSYGEVAGRLDLPNIGDELHHFSWNAASGVLRTRLSRGLQPDHLLSSGYGHRLHVWNLRKRKHEQVIDLGKEYQMVLELRPSHNPNRTYGFVGVVISLKDLSASIWLWNRDNGKWGAKKIIEIPAEPAEPDLLPPLLQGFKAVPPLVTDLNLSLDDKWLYVSCWGTGELRRYDVSVPDEAPGASARLR